MSLQFEIVWINQKQHPYYLIARQLVPGQHFSLLDTPFPNGVKLKPITNATHYFGDFYTNFNSTLVAETESDENGFYQVNVPDGHYSLAIVEDGKLYANTWDTAGGLTPVVISNEVQKVNLVTTYKMTY